MKVLLLNPPGEELYIRDNYCSYTSKADAIWPPIDLLVQSGILSEQHQVDALDAMALGSTPEEVLGHILRTKPEAILSMTGSVSWNQDARLFAAIKDGLPGVKLVASADFLVTGAVEALEAFGILDGVLVDYTTPELARYLAGDEGPFKDLAIRGAEGAVRGPAGVSPREFDYPQPRHDLFPFENYRFSIGKRERFATVITSKGCTFKCPFCIDSELNIRYRKIEGVLEELERVRSLGVQEVYFYDPNFTATPKRALALTKAMIEADLGLTFVCNAQVACLREDVIENLAGAGCHTVMLGLESGDDQMLKSGKKGFHTAQAREAITKLNDHGISVLAYFLLGMPGESRQTARKTIDYAKSLPLDFASFNVFAPQFGTSFGRDRVGMPNGWGPDRSCQPDHTWCDLTPDELSGLRRRAYREFYLRPSYIVRRLRALSSLPVLKRTLSGGVELIRKNMF